MRKLKCFKCKKEAEGTFSFPLLFGSNGELPYCKQHKKAARKEIEERGNRITITYIRTSGS